MSSPWAKIEKLEPVNLEDIMSEEVARDLQAKEEKHYMDIIGKNKEPVTAGSAAVVEDIPDEVLKAISGDELENDTLIAQMLQMQFDKEYDEELKRTELKFNGASKVSISYDNYRRAPLNYDFESDDEEEEIPDIRDRKNWDRFDVLKKEIASIPYCGYRRQNDGNMITKHDVVLNGRKNACKLLSFPPEFQTGDGENFDLKLSNKVFNSLKMHSKHEQARRYKLNDKKEDQATAMFGVDQYTRVILYKLINNQLLESVNGVISIGKEAVILHADTNPSFPDATEEFPKECVIKVFKTTLSEFKQRDKYMKDDHRFKDRIGKQNTRKSIQIWAEKEMANLMRLKKAGILCPDVVTLKQHVLVMSFIGEDHRPAPKLKDAKMSKEDRFGVYEEIVEAMKTLYVNANLVHADLSEYNILWHKDRCYFIDVSQAVEPTHMSAFEFLYRDCQNIINFFTQKKVPGIYTADELFKYITDYYFSDKIALMGLMEPFKMKPHLVDRPGVESTYNFDAAWEKVETGEVPLDVEKVTPEVDVTLIEPLKA